jgi:hypothetical protein
MAWRYYRHSTYSLRDRLRWELGGSLNDVKKYFFGLTPQELQPILRSYGRKYGEGARCYAEKTIEKWKSNNVQMAGQTAERLFALLPRHMPLELKYRLIENLWNHVGSKTRKTRKILRIGLDASTEQLIEVVRTHLDNVAEQHRIPPALQERFSWLADGDVSVKQDLLNHLRQHLEKNLVVEAARLQLPIMQDHLRGEAGLQTYRLAQSLKLGNHELELLIDKNATGVAIVEPNSLLYSPTKRASFKWLWWAAAAAVVLFIFTRSQTGSSNPPKQNFHSITHQSNPRPATYEPHSQPTTDEPKTVAAAQLRSEKASLPSLPTSQEANSIPSNADHGPGRVACDVRWSDAQAFGSPPISNYQEFIRNCMRNSP